VFSLKRIAISVLVAILFLGSILSMVSFNPIQESAPVTDNTRNPTQVTVAQAKNMLDTDPTLFVVDVREIQAYPMGHLRGTYPIPDTELSYRMDEIPTTRPVLVYCKQGDNSPAAAQDIVNSGHSEVYEMAGGYLDWRDAGYPLYIKYNFLQVGIDQATSGDTLYVSSGYYFEDVFVNKQVTLLGENRSTVFVNGTSEAINVTTSGVEMTNIIMAEAEVGLAVRIDGLVMDNCSFVDNEYGARLYNCQNTVMKDCDFIGCGLDITSNNLNQWNSHDIDGTNTVNGRPLEYIVGAQYRDVEGAGQVVLVESDDVNITSCNLSDASIGVLAKTCDSLSISGNQFTGNQEAVTLVDSTNAKIERNLFDTNIGEGVCLYSNSNFNNVTNNGILNNGGHAVWIGSGCNGNTAFGNNIIDNNDPLDQAWDDGAGNVWNNATMGNYWNDWTTPDVDVNGIVDVPYNITGGANTTDDLPLTLPFGEPIISTANQIVAFEDQLYNVAYTVFDLDTPAGSLVWNYSSDADWLTFSPSHVLYGTPTNDDIRQYWVNISVFDGMYTDMTNFTITVWNTNDPPVINVTDITTSTEEVLYMATYTATDMDPTKDTFTWNVTSGAGFLTMHADTGVLIGTPGNDHVGQNWVNVTVDDGKGGIDWTNFSLEVVDTNDPPEIISDDVRICYEDMSYSVVYEANDIDLTGDTLTWGLVTNAPFLSMDSSTGNLTGTPRASHIGNYWVNVSVSDGRGGSDNSNFSLKVNNTNDGPLGVDWTLTVFEDFEPQLFDLGTIFTDEDGDDLQFFVKDQVNLNASVTGSWLDFSGEPNWNGWENLSVAASDLVLVDEVILSIHVVPVNDPISLVRIGLETGGTPKVNITNETALGFTSTVEDVDLDFEGDSFTYRWTSNISGQLGTASSISGILLPIGEHLITLNVTDKAGSGREDEIIVTVKNASEPVTPPPDDDIVDDDIVEDDDDTEEDDSWKNMMFIVIIVLLVIIIVLFVVLIFKPKKEEEKMERADELMDWEEGDEDEDDDEDPLGPGDLEDDFEDEDDEDWGDVTDWDDDDEDWPAEDDEPDLDEPEPDLEDEDDLMDDEEEDLDDEVEEESPEAPPKKKAKTKGKGKKGGGKKKKR
jgi:rhodanese-related sulfurtransferase